MRQHNVIDFKIPCESTGCHYPNCDCYNHIEPVEKVYETSEMPNHKKTSIKILLGLFSGLIIQLAVIIICLAWYYMGESGLWFLFSAIMFVWSLFGFSRIKKMSKNL